MIHDLLTSDMAIWLQRQHPVLQEAFNWIRATPADAPDGITELRGRDLYVNVHGYHTLPADQCRWESHRHTVDVQYCISGGEVIETAPAGLLLPLDDYSGPTDTEHWQADARSATRLRMIRGTFAIFLPNELHRPKVADGEACDVRKLVVKIRSSLLTP